MKKLFTLLTFSALCVVSWAQQATLKGKVQDAEDKSPVPFSNVAVVGTSTGATTDIDGNYTLKLNPGTYKLKISSVGFTALEQSVTLAAGETKSLNFELIKGIELGLFTKTEGKYEKRIEEVTVSLDVIKPNIIENKNATSAEQALQQTPGLVIVDSEPQLRGGSGYSFGAGSRVMVLVDDLPLLSGDAGRPSWGFIPVENIEQIEVVKGASSVLYGSGALAGVINIRSAFPTNTPKTKVTFFGGVYNLPKAHKWNQAPNLPFNSGLSFLHSRKLGKHNEFDLVVAGNLFKERGYIGPNLQDSAGYKNQSNSGEFDNRARMNFNFRHRIQKVEGLAWGVNGNFMYSESASSFIWAGPNGDSTYRSMKGTTTRTLQTVFHVDPYIMYQQKSGTTHNLRFRYFYLDNNNSNNQGNSSQLFFGEYQTRIVIPRIKDFSITPGVMATYTIGKAQLFAGQPPVAYAPYDSVRTNRISTDNTNLAIYMQLEKKFFKRLTVSGGFRLEMFNMGKYDNYSLVDTSAGGVGVKDTSMVFSENNLNKKFLPVFRLGLNYKAAEETYIRASFGQGYRFPTIAERFVKTTVGPAQVYPNPNLIPEQSMNFELGVKQGFKLGKFMGYFDAAGFYQRFNNTIEFTFAQWGTFADPLFGLGFRSVNIGKSRVWGAEASVMGTGKLTKDLTMNVLIGYTYTNPKVQNRDFIYAQDSQGKQLSNRATSDTVNSDGYLLKYRFEHLVRADVEFIYKKLLIGASFRYNSMMRNIDNAFYDFEALGVLKGVDASRNKKGDYVIDFRVGYEVHKGHKVNFIVNNVLNRVYALRPLAPEAPRYFCLQYQVQF